MKFHIPTVDDKNRVKITLEYEDNREVSLRANGTTILWLRADGTIQRNFISGTALSRMGFKLDEGGVIFEER